MGGGQADAGGTREHTCWSLGFRFRLYFFLAGVPAGVPGLPWVGPPEPSGSASDVAKFLPAGLRASLAGLWAFALGSFRCCWFRWPLESLGCADGAALNKVPFFFPVTGSILPGFSGAFFFVIAGTTDVLDLALALPAFVASGDLVAWTCPDLSFCIGPWASALPGVLRMALVGSRPFLCFFLLI